ncbi:hypothetical protein Plhal304r1_c001g0000061 [Plasmopara halstedii]
MDWRSETIGNSSRGVVEILEVMNPLSLCTKSRAQKLGNCMLLEMIHISLKYFMQLTLTA